MHIKAQHQSHIISAVNVVEGSLFIASFRKKDIQKVSHSLLKLFLQRNTSSLFSYNESGSKVTLILDKQALSAFPRECLTVSHGWRGLEITLGECGYTESGVISQLTSALSEHHITIHYLSTYNTDYILVPEHQLSDAINCFLQNFNIEIEVDDTRMSSSPLASCASTPELVAVNMQGQAIFPTKLSSSTSLSSSCDLSSSPTSVKLTTSPHSLCLASIEKEDSPLCMDAILNHIFFPKRSDEHYFFSFTETPNELSMILDQRDISDFPQISCMSRKLLVETYPWRAIKRAEKASQDETGFVNSVSKTLAAAKISLLYMSTHNSSVVLVRENNIQDAVTTLKNNGFEVLGNV